jgi:hypothetical protein
MSKFKNPRLVLLLIAYLGSYVVLSRRGHDEAVAMAIPGFYFFTPEPTREWRLKNWACNVLFYPLIELDVWFGTGLHPAYPPLFGLSQMR